MAKKWSIKGKTKAKKSDAELPFEEPGEVVRSAKKTSDERKPDVAIRKTKEGNESPNARKKVPPAPDLDASTEEGEPLVAKPRAKERPPYRGPAERDEDFVTQGAYPQDFPERDAPAEAEQRVLGKRAKRTRKGERRKKSEKEGRKEGEGTSRKGEEGDSPRKGEGGDPLPVRPDATSHEQESSGKHGQTGLDKEQTNTALAPGSIEQTNTASDSVMVAMAIQNRRPLPVLRDLAVDQNAEMKKVKRLPGYACSTCQIGPECSEFQEGYVCAYNESFSAFPSRDAESVLSNMVEIVDTNKQRLRMAYLNERISSGGMADPNVTRLSEVVSSQLKSLIDLQQEMTKVTVSVQGSPARVQEAVGGSERTGPGILSRLFGGSPSSAGMNQSSLPESTTSPQAVIDVKPLEEQSATPTPAPGGQTAGDTEQKG